MLAGGVAMRLAKASPGEGKGRKSEERVARLRANISKLRRVRGEVEDFSEREAAVERAEAELETQGGTRQVRRAVERQRSSVEERRLVLLERNDELIATLLREKRPIAGMASAEGPSECDELLHLVVEEFKLLPLLSGLHPPAAYQDETTGKTVVRREMHPPEILALLSLLVRDLGILGGPDVQSKLLTDPKWMVLLGFTVAEVKSGATHRSEGLRGKTREGAGGRFVEPDELGPVRNSGAVEDNRGALSWQTLAAYEEALEEATLELVVNSVVALLAKRGFFKRSVRACLDSTGQEVPPSFTGAGVVKKKVKVHTKARRPRELEVPVQGFKTWYVMEAETGIPLAVAFDTINKPENEHARRVVRQAAKNLEGYARIESLAVDRGFLDGDFLWWLKTEQRISWVCPAKENMDVTREARSRVEEALAEAAGRLGNGDGVLALASRLAARQEVLDGVRFFEREGGNGKPSLVVAQVDSLTCTDFYGPGGSDSSRVHSKKFRPTELHATVVLRWPDRGAEDLADQALNDPDAKGPVVLLSPNPDHGLVRYDHYDERSLIENRVNREAKQNLCLGRSLARNAQAMRTAVYFSTVALILRRALSIIQEQADAQERRREPLGLKRYRRNAEVRTRMKVIVFTHEHYGLFFYDDFLRLAGVPVFG
jgi:hypothetical protein